MKVICIAKVEKEKFVKYYVTNLFAFQNFLDKKFPFWRYFNVYSTETNKQIANYTKKKRFVKYV